MSIAVPLVHAASEALFLSSLGIGKIPPTYLTRLLCTAAVSLFAKNRGLLSQGEPGRSAGHQTLGAFAPNRAES